MDFRVRGPPDLMERRGRGEEREVEPRQVSADCQNLHSLVYNQGTLRETKYSHQPVFGDGKLSMSKTTNVEICMVFSWETPL